MGSVDTEIRADRDGIPEATARRAAAAVARFALGQGSTKARQRQIAGELLEMLGLRDTQEPIPEPAPPPRCAHGHRIAPESDVCALCEQYVSVDGVRMLAERIKRDTGLTFGAIAERIGVHPGGFLSALAPTRKQRRIKRSTHAALVQLAEELSV